MLCCKRCLRRCSRRCGCTDNFNSVMSIDEVRSDFRYVLLPNNVFLKFWDLIMLFLLIVLMFSIPFSIGVSAGILTLHFGVTVWFSLNMIVYSFFVIDTILYFFRAYYDSNHRLVCNHSVIVYNYLTGWFWVDLIACLPTPIVEYLLLSPDHKNFSVKGFNLVRYLDLFQLLRLTRASRAANNSWGFNELQLRMPFIVYETISFVSKMCLIIHVNACIWSFCYVFNIDDPNVYTWMNKWHNAQHEPTIQPFGSNPENIWDRYILCLYWSAYTLVSLGYGDVTPQTNAEYWVCTFIISIDAVLWAFIIASAVNIVSIYQHERMNFRLSIDAINKILTRVDENKYKEDPTLKYEVRNYLLDLHHKTHAFGSLQDAKEIAESHLSPVLWRRVLIGLSRPLFDAVPILQDLSPASQFRIASSMITSSIAAGEVLVFNSLKRRKMEIKNRKTKNQPSTNELIEPNAGSPLFINTTNNNTTVVNGDIGIPKQDEIETFEDLAQYEIGMEKERFPNRAIYILQTGIISGRAIYSSYSTFPPEIFESYLSRLREGKQKEAKHHNESDSKWFIQSAPGNPLGVTEVFLDDSSHAMREYRLQALSFCDFLIIPKEAIATELERDKEFYKRAKRKRILRILHWWARSVHRYLHLLKDKL